MLLPKTKTREYTLMHGIITLWDLLNGKDLMLWLQSSITMIQVQLVVKHDLYPVKEQMIQPTTMSPQGWFH